MATVVPFRKSPAMCTKPEKKNEEKAKTEQTKKVKRLPEASEPERQTAETVFGDGEGLNRSFGGWCEEVRE